MTIDNAAVVDSAGIDKKTGDVVLTISDHLPWHDEATHFRYLELKIGKYIEFVKSGQLTDAVPGAFGRPVRISLIYQYPPSPSAAEILSAVARQLGIYKIGFSHGTLPVGY
jgi:hypothetical protein